MVYHLSNLLVSFLLPYFLSSCEASNWNNESYAKLSMHSESTQEEGDAYQGDLLTLVHHKAIQSLLRRKGILRKFPLPSPEELATSQESNLSPDERSHSSFRTQIGFTATGFLDNQIFTTKSCSGFVESSIIFGVGFCVPTSAGGYSLVATKSYKTITIIISEYIDQRCKYVSQQFETTQSTACQPIGSAFETFTYYATSSVPLQPVDGPEFNIYLDSKCTSLLQSTAYNKHYCFNAGNGLSYQATCDGLVYYLGSNCKTPYQTPTLAPTPASRKVKSSNCIIGAFVTPWSANYTIGWLGVSCAVVPDIAAYSCFSANSMLQLESGESKRMKDIKIGDSILVALSDHETILAPQSKAITPRNKGFAFSNENTAMVTSSSSESDRRRFAYSPVVAIPHSANNKIKSKFLAITLSSGMIIEMTPNHLVLSGNCDDENLSLFPASSLHAGSSCIDTTSGRQVVTDINTVYLQGIYTVVTLDGEYIVVNGVIASPFADSHYLGHRFYHIHRFVYRHFPWLLSSTLFLNTMKEVNELILSYMSYL